MLYWLAIPLVLGTVVFVHEFGHFLAAKAFGVYAPRFSIGWGKPILSWRRPGGETEYVISWLPIGGYVRMASRNDETASVLEGGNETLAEGAELGPKWDPEAMVPHGPKPVPADRWFESKPTYARVVILLAGVTMNVLLSLTIATGIFKAYGRPDAPTVIDTLVAGKPAERAGVQRGDSVISVDGVAVGSWGELVARVGADTVGETHLEIVRGGKRVTVNIQPEVVEVDDSEAHTVRRVAKIGAGALSPDVLGKRAVHVPMSFTESASAGWYAVWHMVGEVVDIVRSLFRGTASVKELGGPIAIARVSVAAAKTGLESLFTLIAFLSINLAVLNLLPVPILDGGQILITVAEGVKGKSFSDRTRENFMRVGLVAIGTLFLIVMFNDIKGLVGSIFG
ncbi:MAG: RIP metalloprotease RseP [Gemmatimonadaceae bacterium]